MKTDAIAFGIAGILFRADCGWIIGSQQGVARWPAAPPQPARRKAAVRDDARRRCSTRHRSTRSRPWPSARRRTRRRGCQLGNLYFDAERYDEAIKWYGDAIKLSPKDVNVSTDLGVSYYYSNQPDKALEQFKQSLSIDPKHGKTLLNVGIVKAFGKQDLDGAALAWQEVIKIAPDSREGQAAKRALESLHSAHPAPARRRGRGLGRRPGNPGPDAALHPLSRPGHLRGPGALADPRRDRRRRVRSADSRPGARSRRLDGPRSVCGTFVLPASAVTLVDGRARLYFCSDACRDQYRARPSASSGR
jgi:YHS domain-containing protein